MIWGGWYVCASDVPALAKLGMLFEVLRELLFDTSYEALYIEVFANAQASNILGIYRSLMLDEITRIKDFYGPGTDMALMKLDLGAVRQCVSAESMVTGL